MVVHSVIQQIFTEPLIGAKHNFRGRGYSNEQESHNPCSHGAHGHVWLDSSSSECWNKPRKKSLSSIGKCPKANSPGTPVGQRSL